ncbi:MAG: membrane protein insertase YidC [Candidatus Eiseniibacteriota bacterium]
MADEPGQEQRAFWAIVLAMGVLLAWSMLFPMQPRPTSERPAPPPSEEMAGGHVGEQGAPGASTPSDTAATIASVPGDTGSVGAGTLLSPPGGAGALRLAGESDAEVAHVRVESATMAVEIDGRGARLTRVELPGFDDGSGAPVQLLPEDGAGALGTVLVVGDREISVDHLPFRLVSDGTTAEGRRLEWELPLEELTLRKTILVPSEGHVLRVEHELLTDRVGLGAWGLSWAGGLDATEQQVGSRPGEYFQGSVFAEGKVQRKKAADLRNGPVEFPGHTYYVAVHNKYFLGAIVPRDDFQGASRLFATAAPRRDDASVGGQILVERTPGLAASRVGYDVYIGPLELAQLEATGLGIEGTVDLGWSWVRPLSRGILGFLIWLHSLIPNYGVVIILFSIGMNLLFYPLTYKSTKSMRDMAALKPRLDSLKEKYKSEPQKLSEATMRLYKEAGVNPLAGCLPLLLQMPIFFALYAVLFHTIELRQAPFVAWIRDLSQPDVLFHLPVAIPFIGTGISLLPIIMGVTSFFQSKATMVDPSQKALMYMMPIMMTFIFFTMPSGLVLYWLMSNLFTIAQKALMKPSPAAVAAEG